MTKRSPSKGGTVTGLAKAINDAQEEHDRLLNLGITPELQRQFEAMKSIDELLSNRFVESPIEASKLREIQKGMEDFAKLTEIAQPPNLLHRLEDTDPPPVFNLERERRAQMERDREFEIETARLAARAAEEERQAMRAAASTTPEPVQPAQATQAPRILKRNAMVRELESEWPTIEKDLSEASRNGLSEAAKTDGGWAPAEAKKWADSKGKLKKTAQILQLDRPWPGNTTRHKAK